jgi:CheY-like chemotaxis protein
MENRRRNELLRALPGARRYARALAGSQVAGDELVAASLRDLSATVVRHEDEQLALYEAVTRRFDARGAAASESASTSASTTALAMRQRQLLLLTALEDLPLEDAAQVVGLTPAMALLELSDARGKLHAAAAADVLIIEDEPIIAMDIEELVQSCGHRVVGVAGSEAEAVEMAERERPGLILADINLGAGGDGSHAVARILRHHAVPVIFVTAYPERLLTGASSEPAFVITKPFEPLTLAIATYQAVTGGVQAVTGIV